MKQKKRKTINDGGKPAREGSKKSIPRACVQNWRRLALRILALVGMALLFVVPARPQQQTADLTKLNIEDLMNIEVTSVSKKEQKLSRTAAAVFV
ncbi:MAG: hypothetical protein WAN62_11690, partial [Candidatus Acidiferrum sp.]